MQSFLFAENPLQVRKLVIALINITYEQLIKY